MTFSFFNSMFQRLTSNWPLLLYAAIWTTILTMTVAVASFSPEFAFVSAITPISPFSQACGSSESSVRLPMDIPTEVFCFPVHMFRRSKVDWIVPPVFSALIVAVSAFMVRAMGSWEADQEELEDEQLS